MSKIAYYRRGPRGIAATSLSLDTSQLFVPVNSSFVLEEDFSKKVSVVLIEGEVRMPVTIEGYTVTPNFGNNLTAVITGNGTPYAGITFTFKKGTNLKDIPSGLIEYTVQGGSKLQLTISRVSMVSSSYTFDVNTSHIQITTNQRGIPKNKKYELNCRILQGSGPLPDTIPQEYLFTSDISGIEPADTMANEKIQYILFMPTVFPSAQHLVEIKANGYSITLKNEKVTTTVFPAIQLCAIHYRNGYNKADPSTWTRYIKTVSWGISKDGNDGVAFSISPSSCIFHVSEDDRLLGSGVQSIAVSVSGHRGDEPIPNITIDTAMSQLPPWLEIANGPFPNVVVIRSKESYTSPVDRGEIALWFHWDSLDGQETSSISIPVSTVRSGKSPLSIELKPDSVEFGMSQWGVPTYNPAFVFVYVTRDTESIPFTISSVEVDYPLMLEVLDIGFSSFSLKIKDSFAGVGFFEHSSGQVTVKIRLTDSGEIITRVIPWRLYFVPQTMPIFDLGEDGYLRATYTALPSGAQIELTDDGYLQLRT